MTRTQVTRTALCLTFLLSAFGAPVLQAQTARSLIDQEIESSETRATQEALLRENETLKRKLQQSESQVVTLQKNLATANAEAEVLKRKISELMLRIEALGINATGEGSQIEQRLLKAVNDLRIAENDRKASKEALAEIGETLIALQAKVGSGNPEAQKSLEEVARRISATLDGVSATPEAQSAKPGTRPVSASSLADGRIIATNESLALVVTNVGAKHGLRVGMPLRILRDKNEVGIVRVVELRDRIAGAVVQSLHSDSDKIEVGDRLTLDAGY